MSSACAVRRCRWLNQEEKKGFPKSRSDFKSGVREMVDADLNWEPDRRANWQHRSFAAYLAKQVRIVKKYYDIGMFYAFVLFPQYLAKAIVDSFIILVTDFFMIEEGVIGRKRKQLAINN